MSNVATSRARRDNDDEAPAPDLFGSISPLPGTYSVRADFTNRYSAEAARRITPHATTERKAALAEFRAAHHRALTTDEIAKLVGKSTLTVRPRVSELRTTSLLESTDQRRPNASGLRATGWPFSGNAILD